MTSGKLISTLFVSFLALLAALAFSSCSREELPFRVAVCGFTVGEPGSERNDLLDYALAKLEAELGAEGDLLASGAPLPDEQGGDETGTYQLLVTMGRSATESAMAQRGKATAVPMVALDYTPASPSAAEGVTTVRYRVEEGSYLCGYLAAHLTSGRDHPLTNPLPVVAFLGMKDDPMTEYCRAGFEEGVKAVLPGTNILSVLLEGTSAPSKARSFAEEAVKKGADILFCAPGDYISAVIDVAEARGALLIPVGRDLYGSSPEHVLTSLILRDDNALFLAVEMAMKGTLTPGHLEWGMDEGILSLAPFRKHDIHIRRELKENLAREQERVAGMDL